MSLAAAKPFAVAHWSLNEASGTRFDSIGSNDLTDNNTVGVGTGNFSDNAADFERDNSESLSLADTADVDPGDTDWCITGWFNLETTPADFGIVAKDAISTSRQYRLDHNAGTYRWFVFTASGTVAGQAPITTTLGSGWHLFVVYHSATANEIGLSLDGSAYTTATTAAAAGTGTAEFTIGTFERAVATRFFDGLINDVVFLHGYILDATEVTELWNSGTGVAFADWDAGGGGGGLQLIGESSLLRGKLIGGRLVA